MKSFQFKSLLLLTTLIISLPSFGQGLKAFKLKNGLSVYIWEDESRNQTCLVLVGVRTGSSERPSKSTPDSPTIWSMSCSRVPTKSEHWTGLPRNPSIKQIIAKYDEMAVEADPAKKEAISKEINELTVRSRQA